MKTCRTKFLLLACSLVFIFACTKKPENQTTETTAANLSSVREIASGSLESLVEDPETLADLLAHFEAEGLSLRADSQEWNDKFKGSYLEGTVTATRLNSTGTGYTLVFDVASLKVSPAGVAIEDLATAHKATQVLHTLLAGVGTVELRIPDSHKAALTPEPDSGLELPVPIQEKFQLANLLITKNSNVVALAQNPNRGKGGQCATCPGWDYNACPAYAGGAFNFPHGKACSAIGKDCGRQSGWPWNCCAEGGVGSWKNGACACKDPTPNLLRPERRYSSYHPELPAQTQLCCAYGAIADPANANTGGCACPANTELKGNSCKACPANSSSPVGGACQCKDGFRMNTSGVCECKQRDSIVVNGVCVHSPIPANCSRPEGAKKAKSCSLVEPKFYCNDDPDPFGVCDKKVGWCCDEDQECSTTTAGKCSCALPRVQGANGCQCPHPGETFDPATNKCNCGPNEIVFAGKCQACPANTHPEGGSCVCNGPEFKFDPATKSCVKSCPTDSHLYPDGRCYTCPAPRSWKDYTTCDCPDITQQWFAVDPVPNPEKHVGICGCNEGKVETNGMCCQPSEVGSNGKCCPAGQTADGNGVCCASGQKDSGGACCSKSLDVTNTCCEYIDPLTGLCGTPPPPPPACIPEGQMCFINGKVAACCGGSTCNDQYLCECQLPKKLIGGVCMIPPVETPVEVTGACELPLSCFDNVTESNCNQMIADSSGGGKFKPSQSCPVPTGSPDPL